MNNFQNSPWKQYSFELAAWAKDRLVVREDVFGAYYVKDGKTERYKKNGPLTNKILVDHFCATSTNSVIGLYTTSLQDECKSLAIDLDRHEGDPDNFATINLQLALDKYTLLKKLGFNPLLIDSNGAGGFHLRVFFKELVSAKIVRDFGLWIINGWENYGLKKPPEIFPKQDSIKGKFGNFIRLIGRHHQKNFYSKVWDGIWKSNAEAIEVVLNCRGDSLNLIPSFELEKKEKEVISKETKEKKQSKIIIALPKPKPKNKPGHIKTHCNCCNNNFWIHKKRLFLEVKAFKEQSLLWMCHGCRKIDIRDTCRIIRKKMEIDSRIPYSPLRND